MTGDVTSQIQAKMESLGFAIDRVVDGVKRILFFRPPPGGGACVTPPFSAAWLRRNDVRWYSKPGLLAFSL